MSVSDKYCLVRATQYRERKRRNASEALKWLEITVLLTHQSLPIEIIINNLIHVTITIPPWQPKSLLPLMSDKCVVQNSAFSH